MQRTEAKGGARAGAYLQPPGESDRPERSFARGRPPRPWPAAPLSSRILEAKGGRRGVGRGQRALLGGLAQAAPLAPWKARGRREAKPARNDLARHLPP